MKGKTKFSLHTFYLNLFCITTLFKRTPKVTVFCVLACVRNQNTISLLSCAHLNGFEHFKKPENCAVWPFKSPHTLSYTEYFPIIGNQWISKNSIPLHLILRNVKVFYFIFWITPMYTTREAWMCSIVQIRILYIDLYQLASWYTNSLPINFLRPPINT